MPQPGADILDAAVEAYKRFEENAFASQSLTLGESEGLIHKLLDSYRGQTITLIIDAMDECNRDTRQDLLNFLVSLLEATTTMKVFVSSRDDRDIVHKLDKYENLYLSSERNSKDIELFVRLETSRLVENGSLLRGSSRKEELRSKIINKLSSNAHGIRFRWASLHIQELRRQATDAAIEERLVKMPRTLEGLYQEILAKIEDRDTVADREMARNAFIWLLCAQEQLRSSVFLAMVSKTKEGSTPTISRENLLELCNNLVLFDETLDAFRFSHLSVREFLEGEHAYKITTAHALAAEQCLLNLADIPPTIIPLTPILIYSVFFWADHARKADHEERQSRLSLLLADFFSGEQDPYSPFSRWHDRVSYKDYSLDWGIIDKFDAALSYPPFAMLVICMFDLSGVLSPGRWTELARARPRNSDGATHEELAIRYDSIRILQWHLDAGVSFNLTIKHLEVAVGSGENNRRVTMFLLERLAADIRITEDVVKTAASNAECGDMIVSHLLQKRGHEITITGDIIEAAVQNPRKAVEITLLLLKQYKRQITSDIVLAAIQNGADVVKLLLDERGDEIEISADLILAAANVGDGFDDSVLSLLLDMRRGQIHITEGFIISIASNGRCYPGLMEMLLDECEDEVLITEELLDAVKNNADFGEELMVLLLDRLGTKSQIPMEFMETVVERFDGNIVRKFIEIYGDNMEIDNRIVKSAVQNGLYGEDVVAVLLKEYGDQIEITEDITEAIFENEFCGDCILGVLLDERPHEIRITEKLVKMATAPICSGMMAVILDKCGDDVHITDELIDSCFSAEVIETIMIKREEYEIQVTEHVLIQAARQNSSGMTRRDHGLLQLLLDSCLEEVRHGLTEEVLWAAARNSDHGMRFITLFLDRCGDDVVITKKILQAAASNSSCGDRVMAVLLERRGDSIRITESIVEAAVKNPSIGHKVMELLFAARGGRIPIPENALVLACATQHAYRVIRTLFEKCGDNIQITEEAVSVAVQNSWCGNRILELFLEKDRDDVPVTDNIVSLAARNDMCGDKIVSLLLKKRKDDVPITGEVFLAATQNPRCGHRVMAAIFDTPGVMDEEDHQISEALERSLYDASGLGYLETAEVLLNNNVDVNANGYAHGCALQAASFAGHRMMVQKLVRYHADVNTWAGFFGYALHAASASGHLKVMQILLQNGADVNARGGAFNTALQAASRFGHENAVKLLLENDADVHAQGVIERNALYAASLWGHSQVVQILLQNQANVNTQGGRFGNVLQAASFQGHQEIAQMLLENGAEASCDSGFYGGSMQAASAGGHVAIVSLLHDKYGIGLDYSNCKFGRTALSYAAGGGHSSVVELLLADASVRPSSQDHIGRTPLFYAAQKGHADIVSTLAERDPSAVDQQDWYGSTPLSVAARGGHIEVVRILLATFDIDIESRDCFGRTSL
ncbi:Pfs domain-containing protein, partial [Colletotrichum asianum]